MILKEPSKPRILFICNYALLYGANRSLLTILEYLSQRNYDILVLVPSKGSMTNELQKLGIPFKVLRFYSAFLYVKPIAKHLVLPLMYLLDIVMFPYLVYLTKKYKPDLIYSNTAAENLGILIAKICKIKHISHIREFMSLDHGAHFIFGNSIKKKYLQMSDGLIFVSNSVRDYVMKNETIKDNQAVIYNGIKESGLKFIEKPLPTLIRFGIVGVLQESKGHHICIEYFNRISEFYPNASLGIYGKGYESYEQQLKGLIKEFQLENKVTLHGFVEQADSIYSEIDILLMFSRFEGFGRVTIEAMSRGIPVIGFNTGGTTELIDNTNNGFLFNDFNSFKEGLDMLLSSEEYFNTIRRNATLTASSKYSSKIYTQSVENFILKIV
jgi:glycosyltransferase involved in cell wall biosynthesis